MNLFDFVQERYTINKPIRLIEFFAGTGFQRMGFQKVFDNVQSWKICEWAIPSIISYNAVHCGNFEIERERENMIKLCYEKGISNDYNKPMELKQIQRLSTDKLKEIVSSIEHTNNLVNICNVHANDLNIEDYDKYEYVLSYSYPCTDLSLAGKRQGQRKDSGTRSALVWEVGRILQELSQIGKLPHILLMENVIQCHGAGNTKDWLEWNNLLVSLGYTNYAEDMNAKDYGVAQNRNRCFMISILNSKSHYVFPEKEKLVKRLKDYLEDEVDEKYFLSKKMVDYIKADNGKYTGDNEKALINKEVASTINTGEGSRRCDSSNYIAYGLPENTDLKEILKDDLFLKEKHCDELLEKNLVKEGDVVNHSRNSDKPVNANEPNISPTLTTRGDELGVVVVDLKRGYPCEVKEEKEQVDGVDVIGNYSKSGFNQTPIVNKNGIAPTVTENHGQVTAIAIKNATKKGYLLAEEGDASNYISNDLPSEYNKKVYSKQGISPTLTTMGGGNTQPKIITNNLALNKTLEKLEDTTEPQLLDCYNKKVIKEISNTITTRTSASNNQFIAIKNNTKQGYLLAEDEDGIDISNRMKYHRGTVQKGITQTIKTQPDIGVLVKYDSYYTYPNKQGNLNTQCNRICDEENYSLALSTSQPMNILTDFKIRKMTPLECWRLMGARDEDFYKAQQHLSDSWLYHIAGDGIVVDCIEKIVKEFKK